MFPRKKDRLIGKMLSPISLSTINPNVSLLLGNSTNGHTGLYASEQIMDDNNFNTNYPLFITKLFSVNLSIDEFKAHILLAIHTLSGNFGHIDPLFLSLF